MKEVEIKLSKGAKNHNRKANANCAYCNILFYLAPSRLANNKINCCSIPCANKYKKENNTTKIITNCEYCKKELKLKKSFFERYKTHTCSKKCLANLRKTTFSGDKNPKYRKGTEEEKFFKERMSGITERAYKNFNQVEVDFDYKYLMELYNKQNKLCYYSGLPLDISKNGRRFNKLSVDRIDSKRGYEKGNIVLCLLCLNYLKSNFEMQEIQSVFDAISLKNKIIVPTKIKLKNPNVMPIKKDNEDAGCDLFVNEIEDMGHYIKVNTGVSIQPEGNYYFQIYNRSSNYKKGIYLANNVAIIDRGYTGEIVLNFYKDRSYKNGNINVGDRVAQLIAQQQTYIKFKVVDELSDTERGDNGFGSTGK